MFTNYQISKSIFLPIVGASLTCLNRYTGHLIFRKLRLIVFWVPTTDTNQCSNNPPHVPYIIQALNIHAQAQLLQKGGLLKLANVLARSLSACIY